MKKIREYSIFLYRRITAVLKQVEEDRITVYAARASFFTVISVIPFVSLLASAAGALLPSDVSGVLASLGLPRGLEKTVGAVLSDIREVRGASLISLSAFVALWSASKGVSAMRAGLELVYKTERREGFIKRRLRALINTLFFVALVLSVMFLLLFGELLLAKNTSHLFMSMRFPCAFIALCGVFSVVYSAVTGKGRGVVPKGIKYNLPGALFSSAGWILFSFFYSLYLEYSSKASYVYSGLGAVCLIMLWGYFCTVIMLFGAEINKLIYLKRKNGIVI